MHTPKPATEGKPHLQGSKTVLALGQGLHRFLDWCCRALWCIFRQVQGSASHGGKIVDLLSGARNELPLHFQLHTHRKLEPTRSIKLAPAPDLQQPCCFLQDTVCWLSHLLPSRQVQRTRARRHCGSPAAEICSRLQTRSTLQTFYRGAVEEKAASWSQIDFAQLNALLVTPQPLIIPQPQRQHKSVVRTADLISSSNCRLQDGRTLLARATQGLNSALMSHQLSNFNLNFNEIQRLWGRVSDQLNQLISICISLLEAATD